MIRPTLFFSVIAFMSVTYLHATEATLYHLTYIGDIPGGEEVSNAEGINSFGHVAGSGTTTTSTSPNAFRWTSESGIEDLGKIGGNYTQTKDINDSDQVVGHYTTHNPDGSQSGYHAVIWTAPGVYQEIGNLPGHDSSNAYGINNSGQVVGDSRLFSDGGGKVRAYIWSSSNGMEYLGDLPGGGEQSFAAAINDFGQVTGYSDAGGSRAYRWTHEGGMQDLGGIPGGTGFSAGTAISNLGAVVGYGIVSGVTHGFIWRSGIGMQDLGDIAGGSDRSLAYGINSFNVVVGESTAAAGIHAMIWTATDGMKDLNTMVDSSGVGWTLTRAIGINDAGQIAGEGRSPSGSVRTVFLLTPIPEPSTLLLLGISAISLLGYRMRHR